MCLKTWCRALYLREDIQQVYRKNKSALQRSTYCRILISPFFDSKFVRRDYCNKVRSTARKIQYCCNAVCECIAGPSAKFHGLCQSKSIGDGPIFGPISVCIRKVLWHVIQRGVLCCFERLNDLICSPSHHDTYHRRPHVHPGSPPEVCEYLTVVTYGFRYALVGATDEF